MPADPVSLGPYRIIRRVGIGGMGVVYEAVHTGLDKRVALKVLPREMAASRLERFLREARTAAALHHTNIVPVFDVGQVEGVPYYAMQFIDGQPLVGGRADAATRSEQQHGTHYPVSAVTKSLPPPGTTADVGNHEGEVADLPADHRRQSGGSNRPEVSRIVARVLQAAEGLAYAHERGVVHRDIKPSNLLLDSEGVVWVADFGLAFREDDPSLTTAGAILGTPRYMSPEQARAEKPDCRTDVYSLGVTLYELLTGTAAFPGDTPMSVIQRVLTHTPPRPRDRNRNIPRDLETVVLKAMAKSSADRYASGRELADDLRRFLNGEPVKARRISVFGKAWRWAKRNPAVASLLATVLVVFAAGAAVSDYYAKQSFRREAEARANELEAIKNANKANQIAEQLSRTIEDLNAEKAKSQEAARQNRRFLYAARVNLAGVALAEHRHERVAELLRETYPQPGDEDLRGWEWHYLFRQIYSDSGDRAIGISFEDDPEYDFVIRPDRVIAVELGSDRIACRSYDPATGKELRVVDGPAPFLHNLIERGSPRLLFQDHDGVVVWDVDTGRAVAMLPGVPQAVTLALPGHPATLSANGTRYAREIPDPNGAAPPKLFGIPFSREPATVEVWDVDRVKRLRVLTPPPGFGAVDSHDRELRLSPDGRWLAARFWRTGRCVVWDLTRGDVVLDVVVPGPPRSVSYEDDVEFPRVTFGGGRMAVLSADHHSVNVYELLQPGAEPTHLTGFQEAHGLTFDAAGRHLAVSDSKGILRVYDLDQHQPPRVFCTVDHRQHALTFSADGKRLFRFSEGNARIREWNLENPAHRRAGERTASISEIGFDPTGRRFLALVDEYLDEEAELLVSRLELWDTDKLTRRATLTTLGLGSLPNVWSADGSRVAFIEAVPALAVGFVPPPVPGLASLGGVAAATHKLLWRLVVVDPETNTRTFSVWLNVDAPVVVRLSPCGRYVLAESTTAATVFDLTTGRPVTDYRLPPRSKHPVRVVKDPDLTVEFTPSNDFLTAFLPNPARFVVIQFTNQKAPDGEITAIVWNLETGERVEEVLRRGPYEWSYPPRATPDGRWLVVGFKIERDQQDHRGVLVCDTAGGGCRVVHELDVGAPDGAGASVDYYLDRNWLVTTHGRTTQLFAVGTWQPGPVLIGDSISVSDVRFSPDGRRLLVQYTDAEAAAQQLKVWDTQTGQELLTVLGTVRPRNSQAQHFEGNRYTFDGYGPKGELELYTLDGTPVPDAVARERLGIK